MGGLALMGDNVVGISLELRLRGDNLVGILWVLSLVGRLWGLAMMDEHCDVCRHIRQWCL